ncbi:MAG: hypothetical protein V3T83_10980 [Acidobacteriota bacterium]
MTEWLASDFIALSPRSPGPLPERRAALGEGRGGAFLWLHRF